VAIQVRHGTRVPIEVIQIQVAVLDIAFQQPLPFQVAGHAMGYAMEQFLQFFSSWRRDLPKA
jgi:hypothetical protein